MPAEHDGTQTAESLHALRVHLKGSQYILEVLKKDMRKKGLSENEFTVLELLYNRGQQPIQQIGKRILIPSSSLTYVIDRLEDKGFVERTHNPEDRRVIYAKITKLGREKMAEVFPGHSQLIADMFQEFSAEDVETFIHLTKKLGFTAQKMLEK
ncbi:MarR family winged helix-turn-helix transcriptional regulator [Aerococcus urinaeequi]|jgi:MarR family 2-MHQ and catechol resistance regulon transcriptional repressor|uniref:MarR family transcriptional regulator n=4 Tax=Aerococcus TaxID=1375 RepID=A0A0U4Y162_9LACT|nr:MULTISPECIES: MarR family transcriptional regulator [Aerococcus]KAF3302632.1 MarR family transcriptional regulator [Carnobacterium sp. PL17RED31]ALZ88073.1 MarR family transcriptional regulator [Aerococcus urinaeequi]AMB98134.1 MarR family transcriptional regulator [Aerococcus urinaeequi]AMC00778.1 MarR family transcriptional regulator [Aerococcus viridans]EFG48960.1 transcriptional regulator, MarR family [Aerococcus viridans ATCC 11563 = CCUG 4311]